MNEYFIKNAYFSFLICQSADKKRQNWNRRPWKWIYRKEKVLGLKKKKSENL